MPRQRDNYRARLACCEMCGRDTAAACRICPPCLGEPVPAGRKRRKPAEDEEDQAPADGEGSWPYRDDE